MASRELTFAEEAARYEIEARKALSEECDPENIILIERGRRIILKAQKLMAERKVMEDAMSKEKIDDLLADYGHEKTVETDIGVYYLKRDNSWCREMHTDILGGKIFITTISTLNGGLVPTILTSEELDLFRRRAELWTVEGKK